ncbi:MetQ/NlpA family ABC transporter substrate-binding protein [Microvirga sp. W0021]|uniref:MetQ/NlpA family ABC transporter substrate-binding protein n=1 Tax=Hohaiivirga grylli TaxID=3133970 RepID=A0ABV0BGW8_9HYPH
MSLKKFGLAALLILSSILPAAAQEKTKLKLGVTAGPHAEIAEFIKPLAAKAGLDLEIFVFNDYVIPNQALADGDLDLNSFQHKPYLDKHSADKGFKFAVIGQTVTFPMGFYSKKYKNWEQLPDGATLAIPNDPTNGGRALLLLQSKGILKVDPKVGLIPTVLDVTENKKNFKILEVEPAQTIRTLEDVDAAGVNTNFVVANGGNPVKDAILIEGRDGPYANVLVVREADTDKPWIKPLLAVYHSDEVKKFVDEHFKGSVIPAF